MPVNEQSKLISWPWLDDAPAISAGLMDRGVISDILFVWEDYTLYRYAWDTTATDITFHFTTLEGKTLISPVIPLSFVATDVIKLYGSEGSHITMTLGPEWTPWSTSQASGRTTAGYTLPLSYSAIAPTLNMLEALALQGSLTPYLEGTALYNGYNTELTLDGNTIILEASPGAGEGLAPTECGEGCQPNYLTSINNTAKPTSSGATFINGDDCVSLRSTVSAPYTLEYSNDCEPCCSCTDYAGIVERLRKDVNGPALDLYNATQDAIAKYKEDYNYFTTDVEPRLKVVRSEVNMGLGYHPAVTIRLTNRGEDATVTVAITGTGLTYKGFSSTKDGINVDDGSTSFNVTLSLAEGEL